ncbi:MAG: ATP-binding protein [Clostridia bacterium]|nr:ATP-binding protein [Clostridia bacterium]
MAKSKDGREFSLDSNFINVVSNCYFVDKSLFLRDLIDDYPNHPSMLFTRPRRFGKTLTLSMLQTFFEKTDEETSVYFKDLEIWKCGEKYSSEQGKYPVIYLDFKDVDSDTFEMAIDKIKTRLSNEFSRHAELETSQFVNTRTDLPVYNRIVDKTATRDEIEDSLLTLSRMLYSHHGVKPIILIDEYDVPIQNAYEHKYYAEMTGFFRDFFSAGLKSNKNLHFAVITGAMRVAKSGIYTGLNNLGVYSVLSKKYSQYFGFIKDEVKKILDDFGHPEKEKEVCDMYDGYRFGETEIFNPWSVGRYIMEDFTPETYWSHSTTDSVVKEMLKVTNEAVSEDILNLSLGKKISVPVDEDVSYADLKNKPENVFSLLLSTGYLKALSKKGDRYTLVLVNKEIKKLFKKEIMENVWPESSSDADRIREALMESDAGRLERLLSDSLCREASFLDTIYENSYQCIMVGVLFHMSNLYIFRSNGKAGYGLYDIELTPKNVNRGLPGIIIETEWRKKTSELGAAADHALKQIEEQRYDVNLKEKGVERIDKYGIAFCGQRVVVKKVKD